MAKRPAANAKDHGTAPTSITLPGIVLGVGLGGFVDGIVLHQILQWHHLLSSSDSANIDIGSWPVTTVHGLQMNTLWDGVFHTITWLAVLIGLGILYSRITGSRGRIWTSKVLWGWVLVGWGLFNVVKDSSATTCWRSIMCSAAIIRASRTSFSWFSVPSWSSEVGCCSAPESRWT